MRKRDAPSIRTIDTCSVFQSLGKAQEELAKHKDAVDGDEVREDNAGVAVHQSDAAIAKQFVAVVIVDRAFIQLVQRMIAIIDPKVNAPYAYEVTEGLALLAEAVPDLILADVVMPDAGSVDLVEQIRHEGRYLHVPVILLPAGEHEHTYFNHYGATLALHCASGLTPASVLNYLRALLAEVGPNPGL